MKKKNGETWRRPTGERMQRWSKKILDGGRKRSASFIAQKKDSENPDRKKRGDDSRKTVFLPKQLFLKMHLRPPGKERDRRRGQRVWGTASRKKTVRMIPGRKKRKGLGGWCWVWGAGNAHANTKKLGCVSEKRIRWTYRCIGTLKRGGGLANRAE